MDKAEKKIVAIGVSIFVLWFITAWFMVGVKVAFTALGIITATMAAVSLVIWFWSWVADTWW